jgi:V/A-type H+-transporting ATPase subunit D
VQDRLNIPPTKSSLLDLKRRLEFLNEGYRLLERKRELLTRLVYEKLAEYRQMSRSTRAAMTTAYRWLSITQMRMGSHRIQQLAIGMPQAVEANVLPRQNMSVQYPSVEIKKLPLLPVGILATDASLDETRSTFADMIVRAAQAMSNRRSRRKSVTRCFSSRCWGSGASGAAARSGDVTGLSRYLFSLQPNRSGLLSPNRCKPNVKLIPS